MLGITKVGSDTICALATPPGVGGLAVVRVSGPRAFDICDLFFRGKEPLQNATGNTIHYGWWIDKVVRVDSVTASVFRLPHSYTGEDVTEIGCHGGAFVVEQIISSLLSSGVRLAQPGEFTRRAFMNGKMDLTQAEAVADLIHAESRVGAQTAARQLAGGFTQRLTNLRQRLLDAIGMLELELDFSEEDVEFVDRSMFRSTLTDIIADVDTYAASAHGAQVLRAGFHIAVVGYPNSGKSSLFNALLQRSRAIVSDVPGTTRDFISETIFVEGYSIHLVDTAGLRDTEDHIELQGIALTSSLIEQSDMIMVVNDVSLGNDHSSDLLTDLKARFTHIPALVVQNKIDKLQAVESDNESGGIQCSALTGQGLENLRAYLFEAVSASTSGVGDALINARQAQLLRNASESLCSARAGVEAGLTADLLAVDIRTAIRLLGDIAGESWNPDVLESVFSRFCIGK